VQKTRVQKDGFGGVGGRCDHPRDATLSAPDEGRVKSCFQSNIESPSSALDSRRLPLTISRARVRPRWWKLLLEHPLPRIGGSSESPQTFHQGLREKHGVVFLLVPK
jgi:hypothetical protein